MISESVINNQKTFYSGLLERYDIHSQSAVAWFDGGQETRFRELVKILPDKRAPYSLLDVGCGMGDMGDYLLKKGFHRIVYTGIDALDEMVESGRRKYPGITLMKQEFLNESFRSPFDFLICSGAMNVRMFRTEKKQEEYIADFIRKLSSLSTRGCAFNLLCTGESRHFSEDRSIYYAHRKRIYLLCREICRDVELVFRSEIFGFTVYMRKDAE